MSTDQGKITITIKDLLSCAGLGRLAKVTRTLEQHESKPGLTHVKSILIGDVESVVNSILTRLPGLCSHSRPLDKLNLSDDLTRYFADFCLSGTYKSREWLENKLFGTPGRRNDKSIIELATQCKQYYLHLSDRLDQDRARVRKEIVFDGVPGCWLSEPMRDLVLSSAITKNSPSLWYSDIESCALSASNSFPREVYTFLSVRMTSVATAHVAVAVVTKKFPRHQWRNRGTNRPVIDISYDNYIAPTPGMDQLAVACSPSGEGLYFTATVLVVISIVPTWESHHEQAIESSGSRSGGHDTLKISQPQVKVSFRALPQRNDVPFIARVRQAIKDAGDFPDKYVNTPISIDQALKGWEIE